MDKRTLLGLVSALVVITIFAISAQVINYFLDVLVLAIVSAYIVYPLTQRIHRYTQRYKSKWMKSYGFASIVSFLALILPFVFIMFQTISIIGNPQGTQVFLDLLKYSPEISMKVKLGLDMIGLSAFSETMSGEIRQLVFSLGGRFSRSVTAIASTMIIQVPIYLISTYYFIQDGPKTVANLKKYISAREGFLKELLIHADRVAHGIFMGHFITSIIVGIFTVIGFTAFYIAGILPLPNSTYIVFLGVITAIAVMLPVVGAWFVFIPLALWQMVTLPASIGVFNAVILLTFGEIFLVLIPDIYIRPNLAGKKGKVHPLVVLIGFLGGTLLWGLKGFILGPLALGLAQAAIQSYFEEGKK